MCGGREIKGRRSGKVKTSERNRETAYFSTVKVHILSS